MAFQKGQSGNPGGRPKILGDVRDLARQHTETAIATLLRVASDQTAPPAAQVAGAVALLDRAWGKPAQAITGPDGEKLQVSHYVFVTNLMRQLTAGAVTIDGEALAVEPPKQEGE